ncbi:MAG: hypothetical protein WAL25_15230 [Acidimicrobiia bacterium]|jgi:hypothetical protein
MSYRLIYTGLALVAVAAIALGVALSPDGEAVVLPAPLEAVSPQPGDLVPPQAILEIDLEVGYEAQITVDGWPITDAQFVEATGVYRWSPSPSHPTISEWAPGEHTVNVVWNTYTGLPDTGSFEWTFRVG